MTQMLHCVLLFGIGLLASGGVQATTRLAVIRGFVTDAQTTAGLAGVQVALRGGSPARTFVATTNEEGRYEIGGVPPGDYVATFTKATFVSLQFGEVTSFGSPRAVRVARGLFVTAFPADNEAVAAGPTGFRTSEDGSFEIGGILGMFVIRATGLPRSLAVDAVIVNGSDVTDTGIETASGVEVRSVIVQLTASPTRLSGRVGLEGRAGGDYKVLVFSRGERLWALTATRYVQVADAPGGNFDIVGLPPGDYYATALPGMERGSERDPEFLRSLAKSRNSQLLTIKKGPGQTIRLATPS